MLQMMFSIAVYFCDVPQSRACMHSLGSAIDKLCWTLTTVARHVVSFRLYLVLAADSL